MPIRFLGKMLQLILINCAIFLAYRLLFIGSFVASTAFADVPMTLLYGLRLDIALLGLEISSLAGLALATRHLRYRLMLGALWAFTYLNFLSVLANFLFFRERNQHLWEMLLANLDRPSEIFVALEPFVDVHPFLLVALLLVTGSTIAVALRHSRTLASQSLDLWRSPLALGATVGAASCFILLNVDVVPRKTRKQLHHEMVGSTRRMKSGDYILNQAVINPLQDFIHYYAPSRFTRFRYQLEPQQALDLSRSLLGLPPGDDRYPLLQKIRSEAQLGIRNVVIIQVEGLGGSVLDSRLGEGYLMAYLRELGDRGLYFPNIIQSFCATDGSVFATTASLHRTFGLSEKDSNFFPYEVNGLYSSLPRILGTKTYHHYFFAGFRQRIEDFLSFMRNQAYETFGNGDLHKRLGARATEESNNLGIYDGPLLREAATVILTSPGPFTAHIVTATSHSPWTVPPSMTDRIADDALATFQYVDRSIREFIETLRAQHSDFAHTLFVIIGDHTSITFSGSYTERIRVPLILFNTELAKQRERWANRQGSLGSHVDLLPTMLALLDGEHLYSGMGKNLLEARTVASGIISSSHHDSLYIKNGFALRYTPHSMTTELFPIENGEIITRDVSEQSPEIVEQLSREYLALYETSERLTRERRVFPLTVAESLHQGVDR